MQINQLVITNFGIYYGRNEFVFGNKKGRANIILIGGGERNRENDLPVCHQIGALRSAVFRI